MILLTHAYSYTTAVIGFPNLAAWVFEALLRAGLSTDSPAFVDGLQAPSPVLGEAANEVQLDDWTRMREALAAVRDSEKVQVLGELRAYRESAPCVAASPSPPLVSYAP